MDNWRDSLEGWAKVVGSWVGLAIGTITLSKLVLLTTLILTSLQTYVIFRDKILNHRRKHNVHDKS